MSTGGLSTSKVNMFFDESGKNTDRPTIMGALTIPDGIYTQSVFTNYSQKLRDKIIKFHFADYSGDSKEESRYKTLLDDITSFTPYMRMNVINYSFSVAKTRDVYREMIYTKLPERILYGLLRGYGNDINIDANIYIEEDTYYKSNALHELVKKQLNIQSLYRGEHFTISNSKLIPKGEQIGVEITDTILGILRIILKNSKSSHTAISKNLFVVDLFRQFPEFKKFINNILYFEWTSSRELLEIDFGNYVYLFMASNS